jgi:uncharacterized protein (DUF4415 family)
LSENLKLRLDARSGETQADGLPRSLDPGSPNESGTGESDPSDSIPVDDAESQMRKALGLLGEAPRHRSEPERMDQPSRIGDRFNGGLHRRRFVQDGDIPVTVLRRDQGHEAPAHRGIPAPAAPTSSRLQRTEAALAAETAAREKAERSLAETQSVVRDLQTKIGHAELAKNEAIEALRQERETLAHLRSEGEVWEDRLQEALEQARAAEHGAQVCREQLADEQHARKAAEKALRVAESARESAEQLVQRLSEEAPAVQQAPQRPRRSQSAAEPAVAAIAEPAVAAVRARRGRPAYTVVAEPEPVKWWLNTKPAGKRR